MSIPQPPKKTSRRNKVDPTPTLPASSDPAVVSVPPQAESLPERPLKMSNPNRLSFPRADDLHASRLINPAALNLTLQDRRRTAPGTLLTTITVQAVTANKTKDDRLRAAGTHSIGLCVREGERLRFLHYPSNEPLDSVLPHVLETAIKYVPPLSNVILSTPHKVLWDARNHTETVAKRLRDCGINLRARHPQPGDMGSVVARMAAMGLTGPVIVDFHLYTASLTDESRTFAGALLWTRGFAVQFVQTFEHAELALAEAAMAEWGFKQLPPAATVLVHNANPILGNIWKDTKLLGNPAYAEIRTAMRGVGKQIRLKDIRFSDKERPHDLLMHSVRELAAGRYVASNLGRR